jgi:hypothetical protein
MVESDVYEIVQMVWRNEESTTFLTSLVESFPLSDRRKVASSLQNFIDSMYVERLDVKERGDTLCPRFNILTDSSIVCDDRTWARTRSFLSKRTYAHDLIGHGITDNTPFNCTLCHGINHPRGLCPFPDIEGWNGPGHQTVNQMSNRGERGRAQFSRN